MNKTASALIKLPGWIDKSLRHPMAAAAAISMGIKLSQESTKLRTGEIDRKEFRKRASAHIGAITGTVVGMALGAAVGRFSPGAGRVMGAFLGGLVGEGLGRDAIDRVGHIWSDEEESVEESNPDDAVEPAEGHDPELSGREL